MRALPASLGRLEGAGRAFEEADGWPAVRDQRGNGLDVRREGAVFLDTRHLGSDALHQLGERRARLERGAVVDALRRGQELDGQQAGKTVRYGADPRGAIISLKSKRP